MGWKTMRTFWLWLAFLLSVSYAFVYSTPCTTSRGCGSWQECSYGYCSAKPGYCDDDYSCILDMKCMRHTCVPNGTCRFSSDCKPDENCQKSACKLKQGYCRTDSDCEYYQECDASRCAVRSGYCVSNRDCNLSWQQCNASIYQCGPKIGFCADDAGCNFTRSCNSGRHLCELKAGWCEQDYDCDSGICLAGRCEQPILKTGSQTDIILILDDSGSMAGSKMETAKQAAMRAIDSVNNSAAAFALFDFNGCQPRQLSNFTDSRGEIKSKIAKMRGQDATPIASSLEQAYQYLAKNGRNADRAFVVIFTDGEETCKGDPCAMVEKYHGNFSVPIYTIGYIVNPTAESQLKCIADKSGGAYFSAPTEDSIRQTFGEIAQVMGVTCASDDECPGNFVCENTKCVPSKLHVVYAGVGMPADAAFESEAARQHQFLVQSIPSVSACPRRIKMTALPETCSMNASESDYRKMLDTRDCVERQMGELSYDYFVGIAPPAGFLEDNSTIGYTYPNLPGMISRSGWEVVTAHEMGHQFGLVDEYCKEGPKCNVPPNPLGAEYGCDSNGTCCYRDGLNLYSQWPFVRVQSCSKPYGQEYCCDGNKNERGGISIMSWANAPGPRYHDPPSLAHFANQSRLRCD